MPMLDLLKRQVCQANLDLVREGLVKQTFGNASGIDRERGWVVIKPSGIDYQGMQPTDMVTVELETGRVLDGAWRPSSDTATHLELYRAFPGIGAIVHTHSLFATAWAQTGRPVPAFGTTHADFFEGPIPCTRPLTPEEIRSGYETSTGRVIVEAFAGRDPLRCPAVLVASHGPFTWGATAAAAVVHAVALEFVVRLARESVALAPDLAPMPEELLEKHFSRKHGPSAYYGQRQPRS